MKLRKTILIVTLLSSAAFLHADQGVCQDNTLSGVSSYDDALEEELEWLKAETYVITASGVMEEIRKSAASITVITSKQLRQMGAVDVADALSRIVPGVSIGSYVENYRLTVRGQGARAGILYMIDNHPVYDVYYVIPNAYTDLVVDNVQRIEFIRGPGSALYGANAFFGVVNVITKAADDIGGVEMTVRGGSWDTQQYNLLGGKRFGELEVTGNLNFYKTNGFSGLIREDAQTLFDRIYESFGSPLRASMAPGFMKEKKEKFDAAINLKFRGFTFKGKYVDKKRDMPVSEIGALVEADIYSHKDYFVTLGYEAIVQKVLNLYGKVYRDVYETSFDGQVSPPGTANMTPAGPMEWQDGVIRFGKAKSERTGIDFQATVQTGPAHTIVAGATYEYQEMTFNSMRANYLWTTEPGVIIYLPSVQSWPDDLTLGTETGYFYAIFLEDLWDITRDIRLTTGARYDQYSQFGGHVSPRIGLTWEYGAGYDLKLLYGHAFRAPTIRELHCPTDGNPDLDPEKIDTYEISLGGQFTSSLSGRVTLSQRDIEDSITGGYRTPYRFANGEGFRDQSVELEMAYDFGRGTRIAGNYTYIHQKTGLKERFHTGKIWTNIRVSRYLNVYADVYFLYGLHKRFPGDTNEAYPDLEIADFTLTAKDFIKGVEKLELRTSVYNLFDEDRAAYQTAAEVPFDLPMSGRNYLFEVKYTF